VKRRWVIFVALACFVAVVAAILIWPGEREPVYQGKRLSEWIAGEGAVMRDIVPGVTEREDAERRDAVRHIGTNVLPFLLKWIAAAGRPERSKIQAVITRASPRVGSAWLHVRSRKWRRALDAGWAIDVMGYDARAALPELTRLSGSTNTFVSYVAKMARDSVETAIVVAETNRAGVISGKSD
jgi:hypothetical protein